jgi:hypothetical protein
MTKCLEIVTPMDQKECDVITNSNEENHVQTVQVFQKNVYSNIISEQEDLSSDSNNLRRTDEDQHKQEMTALSSKRIQRKSLNHNNEFLW